MQLLSLVAAITIQAQPPVLPPPPSLGRPPAPPQWQTVQTDYSCEGEAGHLALRQEPQGNVRLVAGSRGGLRLSESDLHRLNDALARLERIFSISPECSGAVHVLTARGLKSDRPASVVIVWTQQGIHASDPVYGDNARAE